jgi:hypothetical protein
VTSRGVKEFTEDDVSNLLKAMKNGGVY